MRWLVLTMLAGCYNPTGQLSCEDRTDCATSDAGTTDSDSSGDSAVDGTPDGASTSSCLTSMFLASGTLGVSGESYSRTGSSLALFEDSNTPGNILQITSPGNTAIPITFSNTFVGFVTQPMLAPLTVNNRIQAYYVLVNGTARKLVASLFVNGVSWDPPTDVTVTGVIVDAAFVHGQPIATIPRHMLASRGFTLFEGVETPADVWTFSQIAITGPLTPDQPSLSRDGLTVVLRGKDLSNNVRLFLATRPTLTSPFGTAAALMDQPGGVAGGTEQFPTINNECDHIFVSMDSTVVELF